MCTVGTDTAGMGGKGGPYRLEFLKLQTYLLHTLLTHPIYYTLLTHPLYYTLLTHPLYYTLLTHNIYYTHYR